MDTPSETPISTQRPPATPRATPQVFAQLTQRNRPTANQPANQPTDHPPTQPTNQPSNQPPNQPATPTPQNYCPTISDMVATPAVSGGPSLCRVDVAWKKKLGKFSKEMQLKLVRVRAIIRTSHSEAQ
jgi:hypothetical protein